MSARNLPRNRNRALHASPRLAMRRAWILVPNCLYYEAPVHKSWKLFYPTFGLVQGKSVTHV